MFIQTFCKVRKLNRTLYFARCSCFSFCYFCGGRGSYRMIPIRPIHISLFFGNFFSTGRRELRGAVWIGGEVWLRGSVGRVLEKLS